MNSDCESVESDEMSIPPDFFEVVNVTSLSSIPERSAKKYEQAYKSFMEWQLEKGTNSFSENVILDYFKELGKKYKASTLWGIYSMLRSTISINNYINIQTYEKLRAFIKQHSQGYKAKKSKTLTALEINTFIEIAIDEKYLAIKVALIMGIMGACRRQELHAMKIEDIEDVQTALIVSVPSLYSKTKTIRKFTITGRFYEICKKYIALRPMHAVSSAFFLNYQKGKCTVQNIGINKFGRMASEIAKFLKLPKPEMYTGHCFRKSAENMLTQSEMIINRGWKSTLVQTYVVDAPKIILDSQQDNMYFNRTNGESKSESHLVDCIANRDDPLETSSFISDDQNSNISTDAFENHIDTEDNLRTSPDVEYKLLPLQKEKENQAKWGQNVSSAHGKNGNNSKLEYESCNNNETDDYKYNKNVIHNLEQKIKLKQLEMMQKSMEQKQKLYEMDVHKKRCEQEECENRRKESENKRKVSEIELEIKQRELEHKRKLFELEFKKMDTS